MGQLYDTCRLIPLASRDKELEELWADLADVPMDPETECIEEKYLHFKAGTHREEIWRWFDERHSKGVAYLLYGDGVDRTPEVAQLCYRKQICAECMSETCFFNPEGVCLYPLITGKRPSVNEDGCMAWVSKEEVQNG